MPRARGLEAAAAGIIFRTCNISIRISQFGYIYLCIASIARSISQLRQKREKSRECKGQGYEQPPGIITILAYAK